MVAIQEVYPSLTLWRRSLLSRGSGGLLGGLAAQGQGPWGWSLQQRSGAGEVKNSYQLEEHQPVRMTWVPCVPGVTTSVAELKGPQVVGGARNCSQERGGEALREVRVATVSIFKTIGKCR